MLSGVLPLLAGTNTWESHGPDGAYVRALASDPQNPGSIYAGADFAGVLAASSPQFPSHIGTAAPRGEDPKNQVSHEIFINPGDYPPGAAQQTSGEAKK